MIIIHKKIINFYLAKNKTPSIYLESLIYSLFPFIITVLFILYLRFLKLAKDQIWSRLLIAFSIIVCSLQSPIFSSFFEILLCDNFQSNDQSFSYIHTQLSERCYTSSYFIWVFYFIIPAFFFYGILLPSISYIYIFYHRENLYETDVLNRIGFLINGYKKEKYFWEFIFFFRRLVLNIVIIFLDPMSAALLALNILFISLMLQKKNQPFLTKKLNSFEYYSNKFCCFILVIALFSQSFENEIVQILCTVTMIIINILFLIDIVKIILIFKLNEIVAIKKFSILETLTTRFFNSKIFKKPTKS